MCQVEEMGANGRWYTFAGGYTIRTNLL